MQTVSQVRVIVLLLTLSIYIYSVGNNNINSIITPLKITGQAAQMIKPQEAFECNES